jgi:nitroreductase
MEFDDVVNKRRSRRSLAPLEVSDSLVKDLATVAGLAPSCSNKQPWRFAFVRSPAMLERMFATLAPGNAAWAKQSSLIVAVWSKADLDATTPDGREYFQFDTGMASAFLLLAMAARNLEAHAVAGFDPQAVRQVLSLPDDAQVITLLIVGSHSQQVSPALTDWQVKAETERPPRLSFEEFARIV